MNESGKLICVTGPDGAGKTTQIIKLSERLARKTGKRVAAVTVWDLLLDPSLTTKVISNDPAHVDRYLSVLHPTARAMFIYHCFFQALELAKKKEPDLYLLNSYWYKYYATEIAHGGEPETLRALAAPFPEPFITFYLRVPPEEAFARKAVLSSYETGFADPKTEQAFVGFQEVAQGVLDELALELKWISIDGTEPADALTEMIEGRLISGDSTAC